MDDIRIGDVYEAVINEQVHYILCTKVSVDLKTGNMYAGGVSTYTEPGRKISINITDKVYIDVYDPEDNILHNIGTIVDKVPIAHIDPSKMIESFKYVPAAD